MADIQAFRDALLRHKRPDKLLALADKYLRRFEEMGDDFILPREHAALKTPIEHFAGELAAWVEFVKSVRDDLPAKSAARADVHDLYRMLLVRVTQQDRRARIDSAVNGAVKKGLIKNEYDTKMRYARKCVQLWTVRRMSMLKVHRQETETGRLSSAEREELLEQFWKQIDKEIKQGELPKP